MKIIAIQPLGGKLHCIMSEGDPIPVQHIEGNVSTGKSVKMINGIWTITSFTPDECEV